MTTPTKKTPCACEICECSIRRYPKVNPICIYCLKDVHQDERDHPQFGKVGNDGKPLWKDVVLNNTTEEER